MTLSEEETKILVFEKRSGEVRRWKWGDKELEKVDEIRYLKYILQKNGKNDRHMKERKRKAVLTMKNAWSIGERIFKKSYERRRKLFTALVECVALLFGAEIWGWEEDEKMESVQRRYMKWVLELDSNTPNYIVEEECTQI